MAEVSGVGVPGLLWAVRGRAFGFIASTIVGEQLPSLAPCRRADRAGSLVAHRRAFDADEWL